MQNFIHDNKIRIVKVFETITELKKHAIEEIKSITNGKLVNLCTFVNSAQQGEVTINAVKDDFVYENELDPKDGWSEKLENLAIEDVLEVLSQIR